ncbi:MAG: hypothetical protein EOL87_09900 [Spartobacteria bacterium]|nr:hypothetical protein [Spartobacteria bacterium]
MTASAQPASRHAPKKSSQAFTLIELLIAISCAFMAVFVLTAFYFTAQKVLRHQAVSQKETLSPSDVLEQMVLTINNIAGTGSSNGFVTVEAQSDAFHSLQCITCRPHASHGDALFWHDVIKTTYQCRQVTGTDSVLERITAPWQGFSETAGVTTQVLLKGVQRFEIQTFDGEKWRSGDHQSQDPLPLAIRISLSTSNSRFTTSTYVPAAYRSSIKDLQ